MKMKNKMATGDDYVPGDILKLLGEDGLKIMTQLVNNMYETGEWPEGSSKVTIIPLKKEPKATKCSSHCTISLIAHTAKIVVRIPERRTERKIESVLTEDQFGFRRGEGTKDAAVIPRIISEQILEIDEELCACFMHRQKAFYHVKWTKLMQTIK
jgi:hypothetical protein